MDENKEVVKEEKSKVKEPFSKKSFYTFALIFGVVVILAFFSYAKLTGLSILSSPELVFEIDFDNPQTLEKLEMNNLSLEKDPVFGNVGVFDGIKFMYSTEKLKLDPKKGFNVLVNAYVEDNEDKNHMGIFSTGSEDGTKGFRLKYRDFEDFDRLYIQTGGVTDYATFENNSCYQKWCNYAFTFKPNGKVLIYLNGDFIKEVKVNPEIKVNDFVNVGNTISINKDRFLGKIADVRVYEGVLSKDEMKELSKTS